MQASSSDGVCAKCSKQAKSRCSSCEKVYYCSLEHQQQHWPEHERECATYKVLVREHVGRYGVASRDLEAGKVVFTESAVAVGPKVDSPPLCLGCYAFVDGSSLCTLCGWPVCGPQCQDSPQHATNECPIFKEAGVKFQSDFNIPSPQYECIAPLRALLSRESNLDRWDAEVTVMEAHNSKRRETDVWGVNQVNTVDFLRKQCKLADRFDEELIHTICGLFEVNAFEIRTAHGSNLRGLYPQTAILSHNCVANTSHTISPGEQFRYITVHHVSHCVTNTNHIICPTGEFRLTLRTTVPVRSGQELYTSYTHSLEPTLVRRENLSRGKYFDCSCTRCKDPTELGTHLGTLKCNKCDPGLILSTNPLDPALREQQCFLYQAVPPSSPVPPMCACAQQSNTTSLALWGWLLKY
uniref:MYND-type domain-containing protein n=1 Tax=Timema cristinae TaxID=61476 RepID=A0A7R9D3X0_TIMCR|nr:unnamed protein product [Timema cristinae]